MPAVMARRSKLGSVEDWFQEYRKEQCPHGCRVVSAGEVHGRRVLRFVSESFPNNLANNAPSIAYGVLMESGKTELLIRAMVPVQELDRNQAIIERILESVRMP